MQRTWVVLFLVILVASFSFQNCVKAPAPGQITTLTSIASSIHTGKETACSNCHETGSSGRPTSTAGFVNLNVNTPFDYTTHAKGIDCISCHDMSQIARTKADWGNGFFNHSSTLTACNSCHTSQQPKNSVADLALTGGFDHTILGAQDCFGCHQASLNTSFSGLADWSGGVGAANGLKYATMSDVSLSGQASQLPNFSNTVISSLTNAPQTIHMSMNHQSSLITPQVISNCATCHVGGVYTSGVFHNAIRGAGIAQPTSCSDCHNSSSLPIGIVGPTTPAPVTPRSPVSNEMRHDAVVWSKNASGQFVSTSTGIVSNDCVVCHNAPAAAPVGGNNGWNGGLYHASLTTAKVSQPSSCLDCHANSRTIGNNVGTLTGFDHSVHANGEGDCISCHTSKSAWTGGVFHQASLTAPSTCNLCHASQRPNGILTIGSAGGSFNFVGYNSAKLPFDTSSAQNTTGYHGGTRECNVCHTPTMFSLMSNWSGGNFDHVAANTAHTLTSCQDCHMSQRPTAAISPTTLNGLSASFDHSLNGQGDCIACHSSTITRAVYANFQTANPGTYGDTDWRGGVGTPTGLAGPDPTKPLTQLPAVHVNYTNLATFQFGPQTNLTETLSDQLLHSSTQIITSAPSVWTGGVVGSTLDPAQCMQCHTNLPTKYAGSSFHAAVTPPGPEASASLTACAVCHLNTTPANIVGIPSTFVTPFLTPMDHSANLSSGTVLANDCIVCHTKTTAGTSFSGASFHNNIGSASPSTCTTCHAYTEPTGAFAFTGHSAQTLGFKHASSFAPGDCNACHSLTNTQVNTLITAHGKVSTNFSGGLFHKNVAPTGVTSCVDCHTKTAIANPTVSAIDAQHMNHNSTTVGSDCYMCHKNDLAASITPTAFGKSNLFHAGTNTNLSVSGSVVSTCTECHGLTNGGGSVPGTNNEIPAAGAKNTDVASTYPAGNTTLMDQIDHNDTTVTGKDCDICHTNIGPTGPKWKSAKFHANVAVTGPATACESCHANLRPAGIANGEDHSVTAPMSHTACGTCHTNPAGTGTIGSTSSPPNWLNAVGGSIPATITFPAPTGSGWAPLTLAHPVPATGVTCAQCHGTSVGATVIGWDHGHMPALPSGAKYCMYCHLTGQQVVATAGLTKFQTKAINHHGTIGPTDTCEYCHTPGQNVHQNFSYPNPWNSGTTGNVSGP